MGKKLAISFILIIFILSLMGSTSFANVTATDGQVSDTTSTPRKPPGFMEKQIAGLINDLYDGVYALGVRDIQEVVFNKPMQSSSEVTLNNTKSDTPKMPDVWGVFYSSEMKKVIKPWYYTFYGLSWLFCVAAIVIGGSKFSASAINTSVRVNFIDMIWNWIIATILIIFSMYIFDLLFYINGAMVEGFASKSQAYSFYDMGTTVSQGTLTTALLKFMALGLTLWLNFVYMSRYISLMILVILSPIFCGLWFFEKTRGLFWGWLKESVSSIFIQSVHAFLLALFFSLDGLDKSYWLWKIGFLVSIIPSTEMVRKLIGAGGTASGTMSTAMAGMGMGAVMGTAGLLGQAGKIKGSIGGAHSTAGSSEQTHPVLGGEAGEPAGGPSGFSNIATARSVVGSVGKGLGTAVGMLMGAGMGNPFMAAGLGRLGGAVGGGVGAAAGGVAGAAHTIGQNLNWGAGSPGGVVADGVTNTLNQGVEDWMPEKTAGQMRGYNAGHMAGHALFGEKGGHILGSVGKGVGGMGKEEPNISDMPKLSPHEGATLTKREYADRTTFMQNGQVAGYSGVGNSQAGNGYIETQYENKKDIATGDMKYQQMGRPYINPRGGPIKIETPQDARINWMDL